MRLCFATHNAHKAEEVKAILGTRFEIVTLDEAGISEALSETQDTIEGNAKQKANHVFERYNLSCFADDTGLEVDSLEGAPGVLSARYAGLQCDSGDNIKLLLRNLAGITSREAQFRTVITLALPQGQWSFEGIVRGTILEHKRGASGFGYDPVFLPLGTRRTFAEMSMAEKNRISHRAMAIDKLREFLSAL